MPSLATMLTSIDIVAEQVWFVMYRAEFSCGPASS